MENHAYPYIGNKPIENIIRTDILNIIPDYAIGKFQSKQTYYKI